MLELSIASVIALTLSAIILQFFQATSDWLATTSGQGLLRMQLAQVMNSLSHDVQEARQHVTSCCSGTTEDLAPPDTTLILQVPSKTGTTVTNAGSRYDYIIYQFISSTGPEGGKLLRTVSPDPLGTSRPSGTVTVARYLTGFAPAWIGTSSNRLNITQLAAQRTEGRRTSREPPLNDLTLEFSLRNWVH